MTIDPATREPAWWADARALHAEGLNISEIGRRINKSRASVRYALRAVERDRKKIYGARHRDQVPSRPVVHVGARSKLWWRSALTLRRAGWTLRRIGDYHGGHAASVVLRAVRGAPAPPPGCKWCAACGRRIFAAPPSSKTMTCSKPCSSEHRRRTHLGKSNVWSDTSAARAAAERTGNLRNGGEHTKADWLIVTPDGRSFRAHGLAEWCRQHADLFPDLTPEQAYAGLKSVQRGQTLSWRGWIARRC